MIASCNSVSSGSSPLSVLVSQDATNSLDSSSDADEPVSELDESSSFPDEVSWVSFWLVSDWSDFSVGGGV